MPESFAFSFTVEGEEALHVEPPRNTEEAISVFWRRYDGMVDLTCPLSTSSATASIPTLFVAIYSTRNHTTVVQFV